MVRAFVRLLTPLLSACLLAGGVGDLCAKTIVVISTDSLTSTKRTISGARSVVRAEHEDVEFHKIQVQIDADNIQKQIDSINSLHPDIILTVGSAATRFGKDNFKETPIVFSAVMYPLISGFVESSIRPGKMITGASLDIQPDIQFRYFKQILPSLKKIGVLYTANTASLIPPARVIAAGMELELIGLEVKGPKDLPKAFDSLSRVVDGFWSVADPNLFDPQKTKYILLNSLRRGIPFMGFSRYVVESGGLFALDFDYKAIGRQSGGICCEIFSGKKLSDIPVTTPDIRWFHYNEKTAKHLHIKIPPDLVAIAKEVYR